MQTIFAQFKNIPDAGAAVKALTNAGFPREEINVIVQDQHAKSALDFNRSRANVDVTDEVGDIELSGLALLIGGQQPVKTTTLGNVYATGIMATTLIKAATEPGQTTANLETAFADFGVPEATAEAYCTGIRNGNLVLWLRTQEGRAAEAANLLRTHHAESLVTYSPTPV
ncbi:MAG: hypothetical protein DCC55_10345 [Chloroflexi bacterium]|nr:MAG: hypothetical protein DCC55_10345 [Chloroflexota bacterium]